MGNKTVSRRAAGTLVLACILLAGVSAAQAGDEGEYFAQPGAKLFKRIALKSDGKAIVDESEALSGETVVAAYTIDGDKVILTAQQGQLNFTKDGHGCLRDEGTGKYCKK